MSRFNQENILKILFSALLGGWAGLIAWAIFDLLVASQWFDRAFGAGTPLAIYTTQAFTGALVGGLIGMFLTAMDRWNSSSQLLPTLLGGVVGAVAGLLGGMLGLVIAELAFQNIIVQGDLTQVTRVLAWAFFGLGVGLAPGIATGSKRKMVASGIGGFIGGILGGLALVALSSLADFPLTGRAVGLVVLGTSVGFFIALVQELAKQAELKIISGGRLEGREFKIDKPRVTIGSSTRNDCVIPNDQYLLPEHAEIKQEGGKFVLRALNPNAATAVNNQRVMVQPLNHGDMIQMGSTMMTITIK